MRFPLLFLFAGGALLACQTPPPRGAPAPPEVAPVVADNLVVDATLQGQILLPPGMVLPAGARLQLRLVDRFGGDPQAAPLAASETPLAGEPPYRFQLAFARTAVRDVTVYRLDVAVFDAAGRLALVSDGEHPVNLGVEADPTRIELMAVGEGAQQRLRYDCGGSIAELTGADPDLRLQLEQQVYPLRRAHAASGVRYVGAGAEFWSQAAEARIQLGERRLRCRLSGA